MSKIRFIGLDVHADTIAIAVAEPSGEVRSLGRIPNRLESIRKLVAKLGGPAKHLKACYEAGPTGYVLYWQLTQLGVSCEVIAPSLVPTKAGDRVKTDRRDAEKLARCYRNGDLTAVWVPDAAHEALRDLVRAREDAKQDQHRASQRLGKFLLRHGAQAPADIKKKWTAKYMTWLNTNVHFEQPALEATLLDYVHEVHHAGERIHEVFHKMLYPALTAAQVPLQALAHHSPAKSRSIGNGSIGILYTKDTFLNEIEHLSIERRLKSVRYMTGQLLPQMDSFLANRRIKRHRLLNSFGRCF